MALTEVVRTKEKDTPDYKATVAMGAASLFEQAQTFAGRNTLMLRRATIERISRPTQPAEAPAQLPHG